MKLGVVFPKTDIDPDPIIIRDYAQAVEEMGYEYILIYDHVLGANPDRPEGWAGRPYSHHDSFHEPFVLFGYLAGLTKRLEFHTGVIVLPQRQTALVAKQAAQVDILSGGRLVLGIGVGWNYVEYEALNENFRNRGKRSEEQIALMRELWTKPLVTFNGKYHTVSDAGINPLPVQQPIPVWIGGGSDITLRRMAKMADGWYMNGEVNDELKANLDTLRGYMETEGRSMADFGLDGRPSAAGVPRSEWKKQFQAWQAIGATQVAVNTMKAGLRSLDDHLQVLRDYKAEVSE
ncbi:MAG: LLM class F420-dependent oxidoreductase [Chloroflexota bacterium]